MGSTLDRFESEWREWLLPRKTALAQRAEGERFPKLTRQEEKVVDLVNEVRKQALGRALMPGGGGQPRGGSQVSRRRGGDPGAGGRPAA